jgi:predicted tellurium resistance membrane protein TerC
MFATIMFAKELGQFWVELIVNVLRVLSYVGLVISVCGMCVLVFSKKNVDKTVAVGTRYLLASTVLMMGSWLVVRCLMNSGTELNPKNVFHFMIFVSAAAAIMNLLGWRKISKMDMPAR